MSWVNLACTAFVSAYPSNELGSGGGMSGEVHRYRRKGRG